MAAKQNRRGKEKTRHKKHGTPLPPRVPRKRGLRSTRRIPKTHGAQKGTPKKTQEAGRTAKTGKNKRGGTQNEKRNKQKGACGGVLLLPDLYLLKKTAKNDVGEKKPKDKRTAPKNTRPDIKRIFPDTFGSEPPKKKQKHRPKPTKKHKTNTNTQKQKFAPEKFFKKRP